MGIFDAAMDDERTRRDMASKARSGDLARAETQAQTNLGLASGIVNDFVETMRRRRIDSAVYRWKGVKEVTRLGRTRPVINTMSMNGWLVKHASREREPWQDIVIPGSVGKFIDDTGQLWLGREERLALRSSFFSSARYVDVEFWSPTGPENWKDNASVKELEQQLLGYVKSL